MTQEFAEKAVPLEGYYDDVPYLPKVYSFRYKGYEIQVMNGVFYAVYNSLNTDKNEIIEIKIPLFSKKQKNKFFPYKFQVKGKNKEFTENEYLKIIEKLSQKKKKDIDKNHHL